MTDEQARLRMLDNILAAVDGLTLGRTLASKLVGGVAKLNALHTSGAVRCYGRGDKQNSKWRYNAADILQHIKRI